MESKAIDPVDFREAQHKHWDSAAVGWKEWSEFNDRADGQSASGWWSSLACGREAGSWTSPPAMASRRSPPRVLGDHLRARHGGRREAHPRLPRPGHAVGDRLVGRTRSGPLPLASDEDDDGAAEPAPAPGRRRHAPLSRPTPAAIGGLLEGGGFSNVAVEQDEVTFEFDLSP